MHCLLWIACQMARVVQLVICIRIFLFSGSQVMKLRGYPHQHHHHHLRPCHHRGAAVLPAKRSLMLSMRVLVMEILRRRFPSQHHRSLTKVRVSPPNRAPQKKIELRLHPLKRRRNELLISESALCVIPLELHRLVVEASRGLHPKRATVRETPS